MAVRKVKRITGLPQIAPVIDAEHAKNPVYEFLLTQWRALWDWRLTIDDLIDIVETGGGGGHIIQDEGADLPQQARLNFIGAGVTATNNSGTGATDVTITGTSSGTGTVTSITATTPIVVTPDPIVTTGTVSHATSGVSAGTYGDSSHVAQITVNATGHVTSATNVSFISSTTTNVIEITTPGSGTVDIPEGVEAMWLTSIGAGAGGRTSGATAGGGGGGAGEQISGMLVAVPEGGTVAYTLPAGGAADTDGGATIFGDFIALGGRTGASAGVGGIGGGISGGTGGSNANPGTAGGMGLASSSLWFCGSGGGGAGLAGTSAGGRGGGAGGRITGGVGGTAASSRAGGGGGASTIYGVGGAGGTGGSPGTAATATAYGAGGGGAGGNTQAGGAGGQGYLLLTWIGTP